MNRNGVVVDGTQARRAPVLVEAGRPGLRAGRARRRPLGRNGDRGLQGQRRDRREPHRLQLPHGAGEGGNEIWCNGGDGSGKIGMGAFRGAYLSRRRRTTAAPARRRRATASSRRNAGGPGLIAAHLREQHGRLELLHRRLPGLQHRARPRARRGQRARLLGHELRRPPASSRTRSGTTTRPASSPTARTTTTPRRRRTALLPGQSSRRRTRAAIVHAQLRARQQQPERARPRARRRRARSAPASSIAGGRYDTVADNRFVNNGAWGILTVPYPDTETPPTDVALPGRHANARSPALLLRRLGQRDRRQHVQGQRLLRQPHQRRPRRHLRPARPRATASTATGPSAAAPSRAPRVTCRPPTASAASPTRARRWATRSPPRSSARRRRSGRARRRRRA